MKWILVLMIVFVAPSAQAQYFRTKAYARQDTHGKWKKINTMVTINFSECLIRIYEKDVKDIFLIQQDSTWRAKDGTWWVTIYAVDSDMKACKIGIGTDVDLFHASLLIAYDDSTCIYRLLKKTGKTGTEL